MQTISERKDLESWNVVRQRVRTRRRRLMEDNRTHYQPRPLPMIFRIVHDHPNWLSVLALIVFFGIWIGFK